MHRLEKAIKFLFLLFVFLLPWQTQLILRDATINGYTWEYGKVSILGTEMLLWVLFALYGIWLLRQPRPRIDVTVIGRQLRRPRILAYWLAVFLALWSGAAIGLALLPSLAIARWLTFIEAITLFSFLVVFRPATPLSLRDISLAWVGGAVVQCILGIYQFFSQYVFASTWLGMARHEPWVGGAIILQTATERWLRSYGSLPHPNVLGGFLVVAILLCCYLVIHARTRLHRVALMLAMALFFVTALFSFSRSAWIALGVGAVIFTWYHVHFGVDVRRVRKAVLPALVAVMVIGWNLSGPIITRLSGQERLEINSIQLRLTYTEQAIELIRKHWVSGVGLGQYTLAIYQDVDRTWPGYAYQPVHNLFLLIFSELGIIGIGAFCLLLVAVAYHLRSVPNDFAKVVAIASIVSVLVIGLFDHYAWTHYSGVMIFWLTLGICLRLGETSQA